MDKALCTWRRDVTAREREREGAHKTERLVKGILTNKGQLTPPTSQNPLAQMISNTVHIKLWTRLYALDDVGAICHNAGDGHMTGSTGLAARREKVENARERERSLSKKEKTHIIMTSSCHIINFKPDHHETLGKKRCDFVKSRNKQIHVTCFKQDSLNLAKTNNQINQCMREKLKRVNNYINKYFKLSKEISKTIQ